MRKSTVVVLGRIDCAREMKQNFKARYGEDITILHVKGVVEGIRSIQAQDKLFIREIDHKGVELQHELPLMDTILVTPQNDPILTSWAMACNPMEVLNIIGTTCLLGDKVSYLYKGLARVENINYNVTPLFGEPLTAWDRVISRNTKNSEFGFKSEFYYDVDVQKTFSKLRGNLKEAKTTERVAEHGR